MNDDAVQGEWNRVRSWSRAAAGVPESRQTKENRLAAAELEAELRSAGVPLDSIDELANLRLRYLTATPILLKHARRIYPDGLKAAIFYSLIDGRAGEPLLSELISILRETYDALGELSLYALGEAIAQVATRKNLDALLSVADTAAFGSARWPAIRKIARVKDQRALDTVRRFFYEGVSPITGLDAARTAHLWDLSDDVLAYTKLPEYNDPDKYALRDAVKAYERARRKAMDRQPINVGPGSK